MKLSLHSPYDWKLPTLHTIKNSERRVLDMESVAHFSSCGGNPSGPTSLLSLATASRISAELGHLGIHHGLRQRGYLLGEGGASRGRRVTEPGLIVLLPTQPGVGSSPTVSHSSGFKQATHSTLFQSTVVRCSEYLVSRLGKIGKV